MRRKIKNQKGGGLIKGNCQRLANLSRSIVGQKTAMLVNSEREQKN